MMLTDRQKQSIRDMRGRGLTYSAIANASGFSPNTVKSFLLRDAVNENLCGNCGKPLEHYPGKRRKRFCNDQCRTQWWNRNRCKAVDREELP